MKCSSPGKKQAEVLLHRVCFTCFGLEKKMVIKDERKKTLHMVSSLDVASQGKFVTFWLPRV
jgi:hypothetical protein